VRAGATFSPCRTFRYTLWRIWDESLPNVCFCALNPSTADETVDDPTIRREIRFAKDWGFGSLVKVNAYGYRATDPKIMKRAPDPIGPANEHFLLCKAMQAGRFIACWGTNIDKTHQARILNELRRSDVDVWALKLTKSGFPSHPLYLPKNTEPFIWKPKPAMREEADS
jgi:hypothetical protein